MKSFYLHLVNLGLISLSIFGVASACQLYQGSADLSVRGGACYGLTPNQCPMSPQNARYCGGCSRNNGFGPVICHQRERKVPNRQRYNTCNTQLDYLGTCGNFSQTFCAVENSTACADECDASGEGCYECRSVEELYETDEVDSTDLTGGEPCPGNITSRENAPALQPTVILGAKAIN